MSLRTRRTACDTFPMTDDERRDRLVSAGRWLRQERQRRGYPTAAAFARALGIDKGLISNYETGRTAVPDERAERIADVFGMDILEVRRNLGLWVPDEPRRPRSTMDEVERTLDESEEIVRQLRSLPPRDRDTVAAIVETLRKRAETPDPDARDRS